MTLATIARGWRKVVEPDHFEIQVRELCKGGGYQVRRRLTYGGEQADRERAEADFETIRSRGGISFTTAGGYRLVLLKVGGSR